MQARIRIIKGGAGANTNSLPVNQSENAIVNASAKRRTR